MVMLMIMKMTMMFIIRNNPFVHIVIDDLVAFKEQTQAKKRIK